MTVDENELTKNKLNQKIYFWSKKNFLNTPIFRKIKKFFGNIFSGDFIWHKFAKNNKKKTQYFENFHPKIGGGCLKVT